MNPLKTGEYTFVYELYYTSSISTSEVAISVVSCVETVEKVTTNVFSDHSRSIIHIYIYIYIYIYI